MASFLTASVLAFCDMTLAVQPDQPPVDPLVGTWSVMSSTVNGKSFKHPDRTLWQFVFGKDKRLIVRKTGKPDVIADFTIDSEKNPGEIDWTLPEGKAQGIYKLEGDFLTIVIADGARPGTFDAKAGIVFACKKQVVPVHDKMVVKKPTDTDASRLVGRWELIPEKVEKGQRDGPNLS